MSDDAVSDALMFRCPHCGLRVPCKRRDDKLIVAEHYRALPPPDVAADPVFWGVVADVPVTTPAPISERCDASWGVVSPAKALQEGRIDE